MAKMRVVKTVVARIIHPRMRKWILLNQEYQNWQAYLRGNKSVKLYSATKQQADRLLGRLKNSFDPCKQYPLILRRDTIKLNITDNKLTPYWLRIPVAGKRGGIWVPIKPHIEIDPSWELRQAKIINRDGKWFCHVAVSTTVQQSPINPQRVIAVDLGDRYVACSVELVDGDIQNPKFYAKEVRGIRRHYDWLRKRLGKRKLLKMIKGIGKKETRKVNHILHVISKRIVERAREIGACIVIGNLRGIRSKNRSKTLNRIVNRIPYRKLTNYIEYKAAWSGIPVFRIEEYHTSSICYRCGSMGERLSQARFQCQNCGLDFFNADLNGAINIGKSFMKLFPSYMGGNGASLTMPLTQGESQAGCVSIVSLGGDLGTPHLQGGRRSVWNWIQRSLH